MASINEIIQCEVNPFDQINLKPFSFWDEPQDAAFSVDSIHQEAVTEIKELLSLVSEDHRSRTILLLGDSGSGKSYLLGRLKRTLNSKAFFVYILCNWSESDYIWRHILQRTVDSLVQVPENQTESQLLLWLKGLSAFTKRNLKQRIFDDNFWEILQSDRQKFIRHLKNTYRNKNIYNPDVFFGILHDLTNPELYSLACGWLRGDDLSEESMQELKVRHCIDTEDAARNILANFGKISAETQPIVLCFDNLDTMPRLSSDLLDIQPLFNVNTTIQADHLKNFLVIISAITNTWNRHKEHIQAADKVGINQLIRLKSITLEQAEALWIHHLKPLHQKANPQPTSPFFPLTRQVLEQKFPGGKTSPRYALLLGRNEYQKYKISLITTKSKKDASVDIPINPSALSDSFSPPESERIQAELKVLWQKEYRETEKKITKISLLSGPDLIQMLQRTLSALGMQNVKLKFLSGVFAGYSLTYQQPGKLETNGIIWTEDASMRSFYNVMNACQKAVAKNSNLTLWLIRGATAGKPNLAGHQIYQQIFHGHPRHHHIRPALRSVHYLATYDSLVNSALAHELVIAGKSIDLKELESLIRESQILQECVLLQDLGVVEKPDLTDNKIQESAGVAQKAPESEVKQEKPKQETKVVKVIKLEHKQAKDFILNLITMQQFMGLQAIIQSVRTQFPAVSESDVDQLIQELCQEQRIEISDPQASPEAQLVFWLPQTGLMPKKVGYSK
ncbi:ATP-binding protein [Leptodesmis sichuanensis]|uniref:ATP-binding protein n=1 Tax=Leptodesmis sichuanensis TaxID=2906798 RepID=UPI001F291A1F|nr:ATP-binding protein [Leptodesmis sichuanensis]UIE39014.1 ATP-binding protein [Leptodesmis sichuanensis A121]